MGFVYIAMVLATLGFALRYGTREETAAAALLVLFSFSTALIYLALGAVWLGGNRILPMINEALLLLFFIVIALRSERFWPLPLAAFQIPAVLAQLAPLFGQNLASYAIGVGQGLWAYLQMAVIILGVVRGRNRRLQQAMTSAC